MSGMTPVDELHWIDHFVDQVVRGISICDRTGMANPRQVTKICEKAQSKYPDTQWTLHFHNTHGMGLANALVAVQAVIVRFDSSLGRLDGLPLCSRSHWQYLHRGIGSYVGSDGLLYQHEP